MLSLISKIGINIPQNGDVRYLGAHLNRCLKSQIKSKYYLFYNLSKVLFSPRQQDTLYEPI